MTKYKMPNRIKTLLILFLGMTIFNLLPAVEAEAGIGISPALLSSQWLRPGMSYRQEIIISQSDPTSDLEVTVEPDLGIVNDWLTYEPGRVFTITKGVKRYPMTITVTVPEDAELIEHTGYIRIKTAPKSGDVAGGVSVIQGARVDVALTITDQEYQELSVLAMSIADVEEGNEAVLKLTIENLGNIDSAPDKVQIQIQDLNRNVLEDIEISAIDIIPISNRKDIYVKFKPNVNPGEYFAHVKVFYADQILREDDLVFRQLGSAVVSSRGLAVDADFLSRVFGENLPLNISLVLFEAMIAIVVVALLRKKGKYSKEMVVRTNLIAGIVFVIIVLVSIVVLNSQPLGTVLGENKSTGVNYLSSTSPAVQGLSVKSDVVYYPIYQKADDTSEVVYQAVEGEEFDIIEDQGDWLKVSLPEEAEGWLSRAHVRP